MGGFRPRVLGVAAVACVMLLAPPRSAAQESVAFYSSVSIPTPADFVSAFVTGIAVAGPQVRVAWVGQRSSGPLDWGYDASVNGGLSFNSVVGFFSYTYDAVRARVAALSTGAFAYVWSDRARGEVRLEIEEGDSFRAPPDPLVSFSTDFDIGADDTGAYIAWTEGYWGNSSVQIGALDLTTLQFARTRTVSAVSSGLVSNVRLSVLDGVLALAWLRLLNNTSTVMFSSMGQDLQSSSPVSVSGNASSDEGIPTLALGPGGLAFVGFGRVYTPGPIRAWTAPRNDTFQPIPGFASSIGAQIVDGLAATFDAQGRLLLSWVDSLAGNLTQDSVTRFTRTVSGVSGFLPTSRLDADLTIKTAAAVAADADGRAFVAWTELQPMEVHVAREVSAPPTVGVGPVWVPFVILGVDLTAVAGVLIFLRRSRPPDTSA